MPKSTAPLPLRSKEEREALILKNLPLVKYAINRMFGSCYDNPLVRRVGNIEDLISIGTFALIDAADHWDPDYKKDGKGANFCTYAIVAIKRKIGKAITEDGVIRVPCYHGTNYRGLDRENIPSHLANAAARARECYTFSCTDRCKNTPEEIFDIIDKTTSNDNEINSRELRDKIKEAMKCLDARYQQIINMLFFECMTLEEVGKELHITKERVRQLRDKALHRMKEPLTTINSEMPL